MYLSVHSVVLSCHLFLSSFTRCHSKWVSILVPDYEIMQMLWNGHKFCYFFIINSLWFYLSWNPTMKWPLKSGFTASVMFKTLSNLFTAYCFITIFQHWYAMSAWITQSINFSKSKRDDNDDLVRYDIWSNKKNAGPFPWDVGPIINKSVLYTIRTSYHVHCIF